MQLSLQEINVIESPAFRFDTIILRKRQVYAKGAFIKMVKPIIRDVRILMKMAVEKLATGLLLAHNHPSGSLTPSTEDKRLTQKIIEAGKLLDIRVLDHVVITDKQFFSFADHSML